MGLGEDAEQKKGKLTQASTNRFRKKEIGKQSNGSSVSNRGRVVCCRLGTSEECK